MKALASEILRFKGGVEKRVVEKPNIFIGFARELMYGKMFGARGFIVDGYEFKYRRKITITEQSGRDLENYPIRIDLDSSNFDFSKFENNGLDIRFTDLNGNVLNHWTELMDIANQQAKIWVLLEEIPANGTVEIYMYYGSDAGYGRAPPTTMFPEGSIILEDPNADLLAEDIVYDPETGKWWLIFNDRSVDPWGIGFAYADSIEGPYTRDSYVYQVAGKNINAPSILAEKVDGYWYIFFGLTDSTDTPAADIYCIKSTTINGGYGDPIGPLVTRGGAGAWNEIRSCEPFVMRIPDYQDLGLPNEYVMVFMGEDKSDTRGRETCGVAWASHPEGSWTEYENNPIIPPEYPSNPPSGKWNAGESPYPSAQAPDPFIFRYKDIFYIGVTGAASGSYDCTIGLYYTRDWVNFKEYPYNPILGLGSTAVHGVIRGSIIEHNGYYYLVYTSNTDTYRKCALTKVEVNRLGKDPFLVLFYDDFESYDIDSEAKPVWKVENAGFKVGTEDSNKIYNKTGSESSSLSIKWCWCGGGDYLIIEGKLKHLDADRLAEFTMRGSAYIAAYGYQDELRFDKDGTTVATTPATVNANVWYWAKLICQAGTFKLVLDGQTLEWTDSSPYKITSCGVRCGGTATGAFDNIYIRPYTEPEPSVSIGGEEVA